MRFWPPKCVGQKNTFFKKQSGEVTENKGLATKNKAEQTQKQSGEVVENTFLWKKQTQNKPKNKPGHVVENK
ncbi:MAG: hypothetical protein WB819_16310 [Terriglobia bacterium]|jgi:hypothetical protein